MSDADEYAKVARGRLKIKINSSVETSDSSISKKKKKHKKKEKERLERIAREQKDDEDQQLERAANRASGSKLEITKAEQAFRKMQEQMQEKRIMEKASLTHKQRVEKFNEHLDGLTEHFDIPKVSWTK